MQLKSWSTTIAIAIATIAAGAVAGHAKVYRGPATHVGNGTIRAVVVTDASNQPTAYGVEFTAAMLEGLPAKPGSDPELDWNYTLTLPKNAPATGVNHVLVDWHPLGHVPKNVYTVPHFDFHFYTISSKEQMAIHYPHPETPDITGVTQPSKEIVPAGYITPPGTQTSEMGLHAVPMNAPELHGKPFVHTLIYGYWQGKLIFTEPMITMAFFKTKGHYSATVPTPASYSSPGYYPTRYSVSYNPRTKVYWVMLEGLKAWHAEKIAMLHK